MKNSPNQPRGKSARLFPLFLLISCLLHLIVGLVLLQFRIFPTVPPKPEETRVTIQQRPNWLELDQKPQNPATQPPETKRVAQANQHVKQESAPLGEDSRDQKASAARQPVAAKQKSREAEPRPKPLATREKEQPRPALPPDRNGEQNPLSENLPQPAPRVDLPDLKNLTRLAPNTLARLKRQEQEQRIQKRPDLEMQSDEVWLNLRQFDNKLLSFFRRFRDRVEAVWNYPVEASSQGIEGTLLLKIVVNKKGELLDVLPLEGSGSEILDYEAIQAVYRAAPFGALPKSYPHEQLKIYAHFQYSLSQRFIYGRP